MMFQDDNETIIIEDDFMSSVYRNGELIGPFSIVYPNCRINYDCGYIIKPDNTIVCSVGASLYIAQYDGCKEGEINLNY